jgi:predicted  nucleic acid-binding Zn-ribbon protein
LSKLEQVQALDLQIGAILAKKAEFPKRLAVYEQEIKTHTDKFNEKKKIVDELERARRQQLGALELNEERAKRSAEKQEAIKTNQEYMALQKEIESLKKNSAVIQENANKVTTELEKHQKELEVIETALKESTGKRDAENSKISGETTGFDGELNRLMALRKDATVGIDARYLSTYDRVRQGRSGLGIVAAAGGCCKGCNMRIPPQIYNELQRWTELFTCPSCKRILVYKDEQSKPSAQSTAAANG